MQGLTEFFPVSSSGHLGLCERLLHVELWQRQGPLLEVALHAGTLAAVLVFVRRDLKALARALLAGAGAGDAAAPDVRRLARHVAVASLPVALVGLLLRPAVERLFQTGWVIGCGFLATALMLLSSRRLKRGDRAMAAAPAAAALAIGMAQALAVMPGISRSGATIVAALALGVAPLEAGRFSFLLSIPVIGGAALLEAGEILDLDPALVPALGAGVVASFLAGLLALRFLTALLRHGRLHAFAYYLFPLGLLALYLLHPAR